VGPAYLFGAGTAATSNNDFSVSDIGWAVNTAYLHYLASGIAYNTSLLFMFVSGNEVKSRLNYRGYAFKSYIGDVSLQFNFQPILYFSGNVNFIDPYLIIGTGIVGAYVPWWQFSDPLRPDATDKLRHRTVGYEIIGGFGVKLLMTSQINVCFECAYHGCSSDYLDGYHPIDAKHNDVYVVSVIKIAFLLRQNTRGVKLYD
jgi:hypothetical protein